MGDDVRDRERQRFAVLDVFGITLEVSNPRLAELLTMDAGEALISDVRDLIATDGRAVAEALPSVVVAMPTPHSEEVARAREAFRRRADALGERLGFHVAADATWSSPTGIDILTRTVERPLTVAAAAHYVAEVGALTDRLPDTTSVLFIVDCQQTADVFKVAIRQRRLHNLMRTVAIEALEDLGRQHDRGRVGHQGVLILLAPIADIDAGELLSVLRADEAAAGSDAGGAP